MSRSNIEFYSQATQKEQQLLVFYPQDEIENTLVLLHGLGGNYQTISQKMDLQTLANQTNTLIITPQGDRSFYTKLINNQDYQTYIHQEIYSVITPFLPLPLNNYKHYIGGISMGGYGALLQVIKYPDFYQGVLLISGSLDIVSRDPVKRSNKETKAEWEAMFGDKLDQKHDLYAYPLPQITYFIACGQDDYLLPASQKLMDKLDSLNYEYSFYTCSGAHNPQFFYPALKVGIKQMLKKS